MFEIDLSSFEKFRQSHEKFTDQTHQINLKELMKEEE